MRAWLLLYGIGAGLLPAAAGAQTPLELLFQAEAQTLSHACAGQPVRIEGNHNTVTLTGSCGSLVLKGYANAVSLALAPAAAIRVEGSDNQVSYTAPATPAIVALGPNNSVHAAQAVFSAQPVPKPARPPVEPVSVPPPIAHRATPTAGIRLDGEDQQRLADCAGRDVTVTGSRSAYVLRGGCRSVTVNGELLTVQAELQPAAHLAITGQGDIIAWAVSGKARGPSATIHGAGNHVQRSDMIGGQVAR